jgi:hypothetical protein
MLFTNNLPGLIALFCYPGISIIRTDYFVYYIILLILIITEIAKYYTV